MKDIQENIMLEAKVKDAIKRAKKMGSKEFLYFLDPAQQEICKNIVENKKEIQFKFFGGHPYCERKILAIHLLNDPVIHIGEWPITPLHVSTNFNKKKFKHSDILGKLLSLGIKRDRIGDINIIEKVIQVFISEDLNDYIINNLDRISTTSVQAKKIDWNQVISYQSPYIPQYIIVASLRLDAIISKQFNVSRKKSTSIIKAGKVKVNWRLTYNSRFILKEKDVISVRGRGRAIIVEIVGKTKKGNIKILVHKNY